MYEHEKEMNISSTDLAYFLAGIVLINDFYILLLRTLLLLATFFLTRVLAPGKQKYSTEKEITFISVNEKITI